MSSNRIRVLIADDSADLGALFATLVNGQADMQCVGCLESADGLLDEVARLQPQVVLLDLSMPGTDPLDALRAITQARLETRVLVFSGHDDPGTVDVTLESGAWGHVSKHGDPESLLDAIRRIARGEMVRPETSRLRPPPHGAHPASAPATPVGRSGGVCSDDPAPGRIRRA